MYATGSSSLRLQSGEARARLAKITFTFSSLLRQHIERLREDASGISSSKASARPPPSSGSPTLHLRRSRSLLLLGLVTLG